MYDELVRRLRICPDYNDGCVNCQHEHDLGCRTTTMREAVDVRPVVRGKWVVSRTDYGWNGAEFPTHCKCTECGREVPYQDKDNFCPNCGADMREETT